MAVVGLGNAGCDLHLPALRAMDAVAVVGACDLDADRRARTAARWGVPVFDRPDAMFESTNPDVVIVATPPATHAAVCERALAAGAHVVCEKPFATTIREADAMLLAATRAGRRIAVNYEFREMAIGRAIRDRLAPSGGREPVFVQLWQNMDLPPWKEPGWRAELMRGVLYEAGIHMVDYALALFGEVPVAVTAVTSTCGVRAADSDAVAMVTLEFSRGRLAHVIQNRLSPGDTLYFEARADTASASYRASFGGRARLTAGWYRGMVPRVRVEYGPSGVAWEERGNRRRLLARNPRDAGMVATRRLLEKTFTAFRDGSAPPATGQDGRNGLTVLAAAYASASQGRRILLAPDEVARLTGEPIGQRAPA